MQARHVVVIAQVHRRAVGSEVGKEEVVVHGGGSCPIDLVGHRRCRWRQRPHVVVNQCVSNGNINIIGDGEVALPFVVVDDNPGNVVRCSNRKVGQFNVARCGRCCFNLHHFDVEFVRVGVEGGARGVEQRGPHEERRFVVGGHGGDVDAVGGARGVEGPVGGHAPVFITVKVDLSVGVVVIVRRAVGQAREVQSGVRGVDDGNINRFERLTTAGIVRGDFYVVHVGGTRPTVHLNVGALIDLGRNLHGFHVARAC